MPFSSSHNARHIHINNSFLNFMLRRLPVFLSYSIVGSPLRLKGSSYAISSEQLWIRGATGAMSPDVTIHAISGFISSLFLASYGDRTLLLDSGCVMDFDAVRFYQQSVLPKSPVACVVATHCHPDHMGAIQRYGTEAPSVTTCAPEGMSEWYGGNRGGLQWAFDTFLSMGVGWSTGRGLRSTYYPRTFIPTHTLRDGMQVPGFEDWTAIHVPGHTQHMVCLYHANSAVLYTSDMMIGHRKGQFWSPIPLDLPSSYQKSVRRLRDLRVSFLLLSHGGIVDVADISGGWQGILDQVQAHANNVDFSRHWQLQFVSKFMIGWSPLGHPSRDGLDVRKDRMIDLTKIGPWCDKTSVFHVK